MISGLDVVGCLHPANLPRLRHPHLFYSALIINTLNRLSLVFSPGTLEAGPLGPYAPDPIGSLNPANLYLGCVIFVCSTPSLHV